MPTKQELLDGIDFHYLKHFAYKTKVLHSSGNYFDKQDFVEGLSRQLKKEECAFLHSSFEANREPVEVAEDFRYQFQPDEETLKGEFVEHLTNKATQGREAIFSELPLQSNRTDINRFNGSSYTYELKSPRDSFRRLNNQISAYDEIFEYVYLVIPDGSGLPKDLPTHLGIVRFTYPEFEFRVEKEADRLLEHNSENQLNLLWLDELNSLVGQEPQNVSLENKREILIDRIQEEMTHSEINEVFKQKVKDRHVGKVR